MVAVLLGAVVVVVDAVVVALSVVVAVVVDFVILLVSVVVIGVALTPINGIPICLLVLWCYCVFSLFAVVAVLVAFDIASVVGVAVSYVPGVV